MAKDYNFNEKTISGMSKEDIAHVYPESFAIQYINTGILNDQLSALGAVPLRTEISDDQNSVYVEGEMGDGTVIRIEANKGNKYKSPKDVALEIKARLEKVQDQK